MSEKPAANRHVRAAIIGAGMAGILATIKLREQGIECVVFEKADRVGGTWRDNTYPGLACDVPAHWYTYSFARNPDWNNLLAEGHELLDYFEGVARDRGVLPLIRFGDEVVRLEYRNGKWDLTTAAGHRDSFDIVISASGVLHHPNIPHFEGIESFDGPIFHSARWDHDVALDGRKVGVIGTGSTAGQLTVALVPRVERFDLFQRTPQWVLPRANIAYTEEQKASFRDPAVLDQLVQQYRTTTFEGYATAVIDVDSPQLAAIEQLCRDNLATVRDPVLRQQLTPDYRAACKRLVISDTFYGAIQQPNANLVTSPIERIEPGGIRTADGVLHDLDVIVLATGFHVDRFIRPTKVIGRGGVDLDDVWAEGPHAYLSVTVPDFPNFFLLGGPNSPIGNFSLIEITEQQLGYVTQLIAGLLDGEYREVSATPEATSRFESERQAAAANTVWVTGCKSWYLDRNGIPASWTFSHNRFIEEMAAPKMQDFETR
ncbi:MAG TPA: NAD(P)/FAD-dependent oxidoreductase [Sphingopyxis sp.]|uniref:flavin-containing monooxygenase n=1 Tax=Sphingopyxis sp. TaxID=1908224 RepID=UPI002C435A15|nr:NAD(P)/FAD-dependent oxidoreductase [Sphingopyxis sp.]HWW58885.1 NAD(P)/FAD-dependent oxidoreductase [Sphingopyxis sp.]